MPNTSRPVAWKTTKRHKSHPAILRTSKQWSWCSWSAVPNMYSIIAGPICLGISLTQTSDSTWKLSLIALSHARTWKSWRNWTIKSGNYTLVEIFYQIFAFERISISIKIWAGAQSSIFLPPFPRLPSSKLRIYPYFDKNCQSTYSETWQCPQSLRILFFPNRVFLL